MRGSWGRGVGAVIGVVVLLGVGGLVGSAGAGEESAVLTVTQVVTGDVPPGATFDDNVVCTPLDQNGDNGAPEAGGFASTANGAVVDQTFSLADGESGEVELFSEHDCVVSQLATNVPAGYTCTLVSIDPEMVAIEEPIAYASTVTNDCVLDEAAAADDTAPDVVEATPTFTG